MKSILFFITILAFSAANAASVQCVTYGGNSDPSAQTFSGNRIRSTVGILESQKVVLYATESQLYLVVESGNKGLSFSSNSEVGGDSSLNKEVKLQVITDGSDANAKTIVCTRK